MGFEINRRHLLGASAAMGMLSASGIAAKAMPKQGGVLKVGKGQGSTSDSLDPARAEHYFMAAMLYGMHNYLVEILPDGSLAPELAESWEGSDGAKRWIFNIRKGVEFTNGKELVAEDVVTSINHHRGEASTSAAKAMVENIIEIKATDKHTVEMHLANGDAGLPYSFAEYQLPILPSKEGAFYPAEMNVGCGAYKLVSFDPGVRAVLERNENYWKPGRAHLERIEMLCILDPTARMNALLSGQVDAIDKVSADSVPLIEKFPQLKVERLSATQHYPFPMDARWDPFTNNHMRMAMKFGVDRQELVDKVLKGYGEIGNDHPIGRKQKYFNKELAQTEYDADRAAWHLKQAGAGDTVIPISASEAAFTGALSTADLMANSLQKAGINAVVIREPSDGYWSNVWMKKPMCGSYYAGRADETKMLAMVYSADAAWNESHWQNAHFNELLVKARAELDEEVRGSQIREMQTILNQEGSSLIPMFADYLIGMNNNVGHGEMASNWDMDGERWMERWWRI